MAKRYNPPPNWPTPPEGWSPPEGWAPDPAWGSPPDGWELWVDDASEERPARRPWWRAAWVLPVAAGIVGIAVGSAAAGGGSAEAADPAPAPTVTVTEPGPTVTHTVDPSAQREADLAAKEQELAQRESTLVGRENAVKEAEVRIEEGSFPGNGTFIVGDQVKAGRYQSKGGESCYWARLDANGEILDNELGAGPQLVTVRKSDAAVQTQGCADFIAVD